MLRFVQAAQEVMASEDGLWGVIPEPSRLLVQLR